MNVIFCGNPEFADICFDALLKSSHHVIAAVTSPEKPRGRGRHEVALPVKQRATKAGIPVLQPASLRDTQFLEQVRALNPDCIVVVAFRILPRELFSLPKFGSFNVHPSLLPKYRGPAPIRWTLINGETETGVSIIQLSEKIDGGGILAQEKTPIAPTENYGQLHDRLAQLGAKMLTDVLSSAGCGESLSPLVQDESFVTKAPKLASDDYRLRWNESSQALLNRIRAYSPDPGAAASCGIFNIKILSASPSVAEIEIPGKLSQIRDELHIGTSDGAIQLNTIKPAGKREMSVADFLRGRPSLPDCFE